MKKNINKRLEKDLKKLSEDLKELIEEEDLADDPDFLRKVAHEILDLDKDSLEGENSLQTKDVSEHILNLLTTNWGQPFIDKSFLEAALSEPYQEIEESDLRELMHDFSHSEYKGEFLFLFWSLLAVLKSPTESFP